MSQGGGGGGGGVWQLKKSIICGIKGILTCHMHERDNCNVSDFEHFAVYVQELHPLWCWFDETTPIL